MGHPKSVRVPLQILAVFNAFARDTTGTVLGIISEQIDRLQIVPRRSIWRELYFRLGERPAASFRRNLLKDECTKYMCLKQSRRLFRTRERDVAENTQ
jgi:hypothetical protein